MRFSEYEKNQLKAFFQDVYGRIWKVFQKHYSEAYIEIRALPPNKEGIPVREFFSIHTLGFEKAIEEAIAYAEKLNSEEKMYNVFWGIALRKERRGTKEASIPYIAFVPLDLDILKDHLHLGEELPNIEPEEAREKVLNYYYSTIRPRLEKFGLIPTWVYYSGHGVQGIWVLKDFITETELIQVKPYLVEAMGSDHKIYEIARILRVPFSINWRIPEHPKKGELIEYNPEAVYSFKELYERIKEYYKKFAPKKAQTTTSPSMDLSELRKRYSQTKRPPCVETALNGVPEGSRNQTAYFLASYFAQIGWKLQEIEDFLITEWDPRNKPPIAENDGVNSLKATIRSAYENVTGKGVTGGPKAQKLSGCSWARSLGLCPFRSLVECPIGKRAIANKIRAVVKEIDNSPRTLKELKEYLIENFPGSSRWVNELIAYLEAKGLHEVTKLDLLYVLRELNPPRKMLEKSPRDEAKRGKAKGERAIKSLDDLNEEQLRDIARYYIMKGIELDEGRLPFNKIDPPAEFLTFVKKGRKVILEPDYELISKFAMKLGIKPEDLISGWELVEKVKEVFNISDYEVRSIIVEAIKDMTTTPHARLTPCIEAIIDKIADGDTPTDKELSYLTSWIKYRSQGRVYARLRRSKDKARRIELFKFMVEMLPGFEGDIGKWLTKFLKLYENTEPFKCPAKDPDMRVLCNPDRCPFKHPLTNVEELLTEIEAVYIYGGNKLAITIDGNQHELDYVPPLETKSTNAMLRKLVVELEKVREAPLFLDSEDLLKVYQDLRRRALWKPPTLSEEEVVEEALVKYLREQLETGVVDFNKIGLVYDFVSYDQKTGIIYVPNKGRIIQIVNNAMERHDLTKFGKIEELTSVLRKLRGFYLGPTKHRHPVYSSNLYGEDGKPKIETTTTIWRFNIKYLEKKIGAKIKPRFLDRSEIFYGEVEEKPIKEELTENLEFVVAEAIREIKELLKEKPRKYEELYKEMEKKGYPQKIVTKALEELMLDLELEYNPKTDEYSIKTEEGANA